MPTIVEYPLPSGSGPSAVATGPDGTLWFGLEEANTLCNVLLDGSYRPPIAVPSPNAGQGGIAFGSPDGLGYTTEYRTDKLAVFDPVAQAFVGEYATGYPGGGPGGIVWQPATQTYWMLLAAAGKIIQFDPVARAFLPGLIALYSAACTPHGPCIGSDGNFWCGEIDAQRVARVTPDGTVTQVVLSGSKPTVCHGGGDGATYCTDQNGKLWRIDVNSLAVSHYQNPPASTSTPYGLCADASGNLVYTDRGTGKVSVLPAGGGMAVEYPCPSGSTCQPNKLALGGDGAVWGGERATSKAFRFV